MSDDSGPDHSRNVRRGAVVAALAVGLVVAAVAVTTTRNEQSASPSATTDGSSPIERLRATAKLYADAILRGTANEVKAFNSSSCAGALTDAQLSSVRMGLERATGKPAGSITIAGASVRNFDGLHGDAAVTFDLPTTLQGNDNWLTFTLERGGWRVADCTRLPIGGNSTPSDSSGSTAQLELPTLVVQTGTQLHAFLVVSNNTGAPLHVLDNGCAPKWTVVLTNEAVPPSWAFTAECSLAPLELPVGETRLPVTITATYAFCTSVPSDTVASPPMPLCVNGRTPPLPAGDYTTVLVGSIPEVASPAALPVTLTG